jgi:hypothetical protein
MKVKVYIVTWKDKYALDRNLRSLFETFQYDLTGIDLHINVINNHTDFYIAPEFENQVNVIHNRATPDFATAMLSRMWNTALIHGFKDLNEPDADIVVTSQDDTIWNPNWLFCLLEIHKKYSFYADDAGDMVCSYTPDAVKKIGLWDERFHYGFGEADYFLRAICWNAEKSSINDHAHKRTWNTMPYTVARRPEPNNERYAEQSRSHNFRGHSWSVWLHKWGLMELEGNWPENVKDMADSTPFVPQHILYPYFELSVENLKEKGYIVR